MVWKTAENEEYESWAPAVQAHFHAVRAEEALKRDDYVQAEKEGHLASEKFLQAAQRVSDKRTIDALVLLAENYEYRASVARARNPSPIEDKDTSVAATAATSGLQNDGNKSTLSDEKAGSAAEETAALKAVADTPDPKAGVEAENQLNLAAAEMEELWRRLHEIGLSSAGSSDKNVLMSSRHLSSSLGDSFCLLPAKTRTSVGVVATAVDGGSTLRAAVASRMRNQRQRLMEQQFGGRPPIDDRFRARPSINDSKNVNTSLSGANSAALGSRTSEGRPSSMKESPNGQEDASGLQAELEHQKAEIVRLLNAVKTLSSENTKLVKKCEALTNVQAENREIRESMDRFKKNYNQKLVMIKRALEEWRRQRNSSVQAAQSPVSGDSNGQNVAALESKLKLQEEQIAKLVEASRAKDERLAKYDKWYKTLKAGAKAKQLSQSRDSTGGPVGNGSTSSLARDSFTSSSSFHAFSSGTEDAASHGGSASRQFSRPPAHPNRRALKRKDWSFASLVSTPSKY